ncbi:MAG TPA: hypothetical protein VKG61_02580 [Streptosporangiaceae bacterium]|nr:hypothetical protein [Streptosporangiaceae bacterium]
MSTVTMRELELETAELLPGRETLCCPKGYSPGHGSSVGISQQNGSVNGSGDGNFDGGGLLGGILNGSGDGNLSGNNIAVVL